MFDDTGRAKGSRITVIPKIKLNNGTVNNSRVKRVREKVGAHEDKEWCDSLSWWLPALKGIWTLEDGCAKTQEWILLRAKDVSVYV